MIALGVLAGLYVAFHGNESRGGSAVSPAHASESPVPAFSFNLAKVQSIATGKKKHAMATAKAAAQHIEQTLDHLYVAAFIDPNAWRSGHYGEAWRLFTSDALPTARSDETALTLGPGAGRTFQSVAPHRGKLVVRVLMDRMGHPSTAVALVHFAARGLREGGPPAAIRSSGQYFLRPSPKGWSIYGYQVKRDDGTVAVAGASP